MSPKDVEGMANSVDPDPTATTEAVWAGSVQFAHDNLSQNLEFLL